nr:MAG TPA: hypothetical protein [Caudoviricetes sp.]
MFWFSGGRGTPFLKTGQVNQGLEKTNDGDH